MSGFGKKPAAVAIRPARTDEQKMLESLQRRASLRNPGDRDAAASFLHVIGNPHAEGFYVSCGFRVTGTVTTQFGIGLAMRKAL